MYRMFNGLAPGIYSRRFIGAINHTCVLCGVVGSGRDLPPWEFCREDVATIGKVYPVLIVGALIYGLGLTWKAP